LGAVTLTACTRGSVARSRQSRVVVPKPNCTAASSARPGASSRPRRARGAAAGPGSGAARGRTTGCARDPSSRSRPPRRRSGFSAWPVRYPPHGRQARPVGPSRQRTGSMCRRSVSRTRITCLPRGREQATLTP
jgi:hypothetical protein